MARASSVAPDVLRITAKNPSPFTFHGTNSYIVGRDTLAVIDPGPDDDAHFQTLLDVIADRPVSHIFVSHTHRDHSPLAARLKEHTGAAVLAEGPHRPARPLRIGEINPLDASADTGFVPDIALADDALVDGDGWAIRTVLTPGHTANHAAFALEGTGILFSADHVMALGDLDRGAAGRRDGRLHGLARQADRARRPPAFARPWRPGDRSRAPSCAG